MEIDRDSEFVKMFAPLDIIGYIRIFYGFYRIIWDNMGYIKGLKCLPHWRAMDIIRINLILSNFSHFRLRLQFFLMQNSTCGKSRK